MRVLDNFININKMFTRQNATNLIDDEKKYHEIASRESDT